MAKVVGKDNTTIYVEHRGEVYAVSADEWGEDAEKAVELGYAADKDESDTQILDNFDPDWDMVIGTVYMGQDSKYLRKKEGNSNG